MQIEECEMCAATKQGVVGSARAGIGMLLVLVTWLAAGCEPVPSPEDRNPAPEVMTNDGDAGARQGGESRIASPLGTPSDAVAHQYVVLHAGTLEQLQQCFTERVREQITEEMVADAKENLPRMSMGELVHEVIEEEQDGKKTAKIITKDGRTLTTLVKEGDLWLADTIWFQ